MTRFSVVQAENGYSQFMVDGTCRYWMHNRDPDLKVSAIEDEMRTGTLDADAEALLNASFPLGELNPALADCEPDGTTDKEPRVIADAAGGVVCVGKGPRFDAAWDAVSGRAKDLWETGAPVIGPVRISVGPGPGMGTSYGWPLATALSSLLLPEDKAQARGVSTLIDAPADADALRALRKTYLAERAVSPGFFFDGMQVSDGGVSYYLYMRDATPYEAPDGLLPFTPTSSP